MNGEPAPQSTIILAGLTALPAEVMVAALAAIGDTNPKTLANTHPAVLAGRLLCEIRQNPAMLFSPEFNKIERHPAFRAGCAARAREMYGS